MYKTSLLSREIITQRNLPHWYLPGATFFITYRLFGTLPKSILARLRQKKETLLRQQPPEVPRDIHRAYVHRKLFASYDQYLDQSLDIDWLRRPDIAAMIRENLYYHHSQKYRLRSYCIMPNHVHLVIESLKSDNHSTFNNLIDPAITNVEVHPFSESVGERKDRQSPLAKIMHSLKSYTAHKANELLARSGRFWQTESYDHWIRDESELERIVNYIAGNPVSAGLVTRPQDWYFSSCHDRFLQDGQPLGWLRW